MTKRRSRRAPLVYVAVRLMFRAVAALVFRFRVKGRDNVPSTGPVVVVAAHRSWLDPACVGGALRRPVRFLIARNIYEVWWARWFYRVMGSLPVAKGGDASLVSMREALRELGRAGVIGVFPEGRVVTAAGGGVMHEGAALLAVRSGATVVPVAIDGSDRAWPHGRKLPGPAAVSVSIGVPLEPPAGRDREAVRVFTRRIAEALAR